MICSTEVWIVIANLSNVNHNHMAWELNIILHEAITVPCRCVHNHPFPQLLSSISALYRLTSPANIYKYAKSSYGLSDVGLNRIASYIEECTKNLTSIEQQLAVELEIERPWPNLICADLQLRKTTEIRRIKIC